MYHLNFQTQLFTRIIHRLHWVMMVLTGHEVTGVMDDVTPTGGPGTYDANNTPNLNLHLFSHYQEYLTIELLKLL